MRPEPVLTISAQRPASPDDCDFTYYEHGDIEVDYVCVGLEADIRAGFRLLLHLVAELRRDLWQIAGVGIRRL